MPESSKHGRDAKNNLCPASSRAVPHPNLTALARFSDPALSRVELEETRRRVEEESDPAIRELYLCAAIAFLPNLPCAFPRENLLHLSAKAGGGKTATDVFAILRDVSAARQVWREETLRCSFHRVRARYTEGPIRQQGTDKSGRPIVWMCRFLENRAREWGSDRLQEEYALSLSWAVDAALRRREAHGTGVVIYVVDHLAPMLNFGKAFTKALGRDLQAFGGLLESIRFFNSSASSSILARLLQQYKSHVEVETSKTVDGDWTSWVADTTQVPRHVVNLMYDRPDERSSHLLADLARRSGAATPISLSDVFNSCSTHEVARRDSLREVAASTAIRQPSQASSEEAPDVHIPLSSKKKALLTDSAREWKSLDGARNEPRKRNTVQRHSGLDSIPEEYRLFAGEEVKADDGW
jgi:hypothetical protein